MNKINTHDGASLVAQLVKTLPARKETGVRFLAGQDPLDKRMATSPVFLPGEFHGQFHGEFHRVAKSQS